MRVQNGSGCSNGQFGSTRQYGLEQRNLRKFIIDTINEKLN